ncbi:structural maintenance of chromosomes flexible hinge domain-containing protein GMI1 isoform X2 [Trifolium pratense]|uniref:structural maintenance of chromosomes flexible hinge domain-containing protein GMI1 isoform X2 n=1 Tax=Trifolium pratense TaxID=57577 RepID=UPI001E6966BE|nr:structural maintenance of chromosomes flexible hinge domain-containing protein GMI1 isoform X2 [Trifolium pratense]
MERGVNGNPKKRKMGERDGDDDDAGVRKRRMFKILLPNETSVDLTVPNDENKLSVGDFINLVQKKYLEVWKKSESMRKKRDINWKSSGLYLEDRNDNKIRNVIDLNNFTPYKRHILRLNDGSANVVETFENMWDLTPDTQLLLELPEEYTFEAAIADLIDNALQAVWQNETNNRKLVCVQVTKNKIIIFDNGPGMDDSNENSILKWGKMGASLHRLSKSDAIGGQPPYLMPYFGMFGYGGPVASMHLGNRTCVSSKTKKVKKVYQLYLDREDLIKQSNPEATWKATGGIREPSRNEIDNSQGSFTKVEIFEPKLKDVDINKLRCHLKDIYFPYIQNDDLSAKGKTITPIQFQVNCVDLTEVQGGEIATTNLHSCNGPEFVLQLHMKRLQDHGSREFQEANARLRFVYFPFTEGKESIDRILENLTADGYMIRESFETFSRVSVRRLGRLLPDARWTLLPFMDYRNKRETYKAAILKRCSMRVKCYVETDAGFKPTQSKTDLAHQNPFTIALKNLGSKISDKESDVSVEITRDTKVLTPLQLEKEYQDWILRMHNDYDEGAYAGDCMDKPVILLNPPNKKALGLFHDVIRVHRVLKRKDKTWSREQRIKVLRGACSGCHSNNVYATIEYFLIEKFEGETGGDARVLCRPIGIPEENGCSLDVSNEEDPVLDIGSSLSLPMTVIYDEKLVPVETIEWENRLKKLKQKSPACTPSPHHYKGKQADVVDSISRSFDKRVTAKPSHCAVAYKLLTDDQCQELDVRVGSTFPTLAIACYDIHGNQAPFQEIPKDLTIRLQAAKDLYFNVRGRNFALSVDKMSLKIMDAMVKSNELDKISPTYRTTLMITSESVPMSLSFPCRVFPSSLKHVDLKPEIREDQLLPGFIFKELMLEMFDKYGNHVSEGIEVDIVLAGFEILNRCSTLYKVDDKGKINLSGLLKLTAGYGENASISVIFQNITIFKQEFSIAQRSLRIASEVPGCCAAGSQLENVEFEIVNIDGEVDTKIHQDDQYGQFHMLTIKSDLLNAENSMRYTFKHGRCTIPYIRVPDIEGTFCFEASHSKYTDLCLAVKVQVIKMPNAKDDAQFLSPEKNIFPMQELSPLNCGNDLMMSVINSTNKKLQDIFQLGEKIKSLEENHNCYLNLKTETEKQILSLQGSLSHLGNIDSLFTDTKEEMTTKIKSMENTAASVLCSLSNQQTPLLKDIIGVVALLGSVQSLELSRMLAEFLGEDKMLGVICRSVETAIALEKYKQNGEIDYVCALHAEAADLGKAISKRFLTMCFENIRPCEYLPQKNDSQRKLALPDPKLQNGRTPAGFMGYAVNMIDLDTRHLQTSTKYGYGLRQTVLFRLFKKLQVYETRDSMVAALQCIEEDGAVSVDGGIIREMGTLSLGHGNPSIYFPCANELDNSPQTKEILSQIKVKKEELRDIEEYLKKSNKCIQKNKKKYQKKDKEYKILVATTVQPLSEVPVPKPEFDWETLVNLGD